MDNCCKLVHPFQNDPGVSQQQRLVSELLSGAPKIDGRNMADLLDYFRQLSKNINYYQYDENQQQLMISDWSAFFEKSTPFLLSSIIKFDRSGIDKRLEKYNKLFKRKPSKQALQLILHYVFQQGISRINKWSLELKDSQLPIKNVLEKLVRDKLNGAVKQFVCLSNTAVQQFNIRRIDFRRLRENPLWNFQQDTDVAPTDCFSSKEKSRRKKLLAMRKEIMNIVPSVFEAIRIAGTSAALVLNDSFEPMKEEFRQKTPPHLALIFAFLKLFGHLQNDLNTFSRKHLDFFYRDVLKLKALDAIPDKAHILFSIQNQLEKYRLEKGLTLKAGKDENKEEILFTIEDEIIVNKAEVAEVKTLFLNNQPFYSTNYIEGVYMAPDATKADGIKIAFQDDDPKSWPAMGARSSKYTDPETNQLRPYPNARLGFVLASPVLYLQEGRRTIDITIAVELKDNYCQTLAEPEPDNRNKCCDPGLQMAAFIQRPSILPYVQAKQFLEQVANALKTKYYHFNLSEIPASFKSLKNKARNKLKVGEKAAEKKICYCPTDLPDKMIQFGEDDWDTFLNDTDAAGNQFTDEEKEILKSIFKPKHLLKVLLSGETEWLEPSSMTPVELITDGSSPQMALKFSMTLEPDKPAVSFFDGAALKEEIKTEWPVIKVELDDSIKIEKTSTDLLDFLDEKLADQVCCINKKVPDDHLVSFYHFFRNLVVVKDTTVPGKGDYSTKIDVSVCGLTKFIVQNDESLQDVNAPIFPFGTRPDVIDFNVVTTTFCITEKLIQDAATGVNPISNTAKDHLLATLPPSKVLRIGKSFIDAYLGQQFQNPAYTLQDSEKTKIKGLLNDKSLNYCGQNLIGPNFYIGSKEVFCKKWTEVFVNFNWKNKPSDFRDYYKAYIAKPDPVHSDFFIYGLDKDEFEINLAVLNNGGWIVEDPHNTTADATKLNTKTGFNNRRLFPDQPYVRDCDWPVPFEQNIHLFPGYFGSPGLDFSIDKREFGPLTTATRQGFLRINLQNQDFLHKNYPYVLARQMMALGMQSIKADDPPKMEDAVYYDKNGNIIVFSTDLIKQQVDDILKISQRVNLDINDTGGIDDLAGNSGNISAQDASRIRNILRPPAVGGPPLFPGMPIPPEYFRENVNEDVQAIEDALAGIKQKIEDKPNFQAIIPNEPWTPVIKNIAIDYKATAMIQDIDLIHLYPYKDSYKAEDIERQPALFPTFCDEGNLFIGLKNLVPGSNVSMLFQLSEATADSELEPVDVRWYYLENNIWKRLRTGFEIINDETNNLSTSGIIKFAMPENMTKGNSILPKEWHWIRASIEKNSRLVCEINGIHTQAIKASFAPNASNDVLRLSKPLPKGTINSLEQPDSSVKKIEQPYESFGGDVPELEGRFYVRVSELLRHKGRAIQKWDYERILLQAFPQVYKAKCITHSFGLDANKYDNDFPMAAGYVLLAVIPDLRILKAARSFEPKAPLSLLEKIETEFRNCISPFVRLRIMNPRYEKVHFCIKVQLVQGKDENYYKEKLALDIRQFMAPWAIGEFHKLHFGQCINRSDIIQFLETRDYVDFIVELKMGHERDAQVSDTVYSICPHTPRSILIAGDIDVCIPVTKCLEQQGNCETKLIPIVNYCSTQTIT